MGDVPYVIRSVARVCLETVVSDGCLSGGSEFKAELGDWMFSACQAISVCIYFVNALFPWVWSICE